MPRTSALLAALFAATLASSARAEAPAQLPLQGVLSDLAGEPIDGTLSVRFAVYAGEAAPEPLWSETQAVAFDQGLFTVALGANVPLPLELFDEYSDLWVGIRVDSDSEMPRVPLGTVPWAAWAEYAGDARSVQGATLDDIAAAARADGDARWAPLGHATPWDSITDAPDGLNDGDDDLLASITRCTAGQTLKWNGTAWDCANDIDTDTDTNTDLLASITRCAAGQTLKWNGAAWDCASDIDTDTNTDVLASLACAPGQIARWSGAAWACSNDIDTNTDTRCDSPDTCGQLCIGARCVARVPGAPRIEPVSGSFNASAQWVVPAVDGTPVSLTVSLYTYGGSNRSGAVDARWLDASGVEIRSWTQISGSNVNNGGDGGSGMGDRELATLPLFTGTALVEFRQSGLNAYTGDYVAFTWIP